MNNTKLKSFDWDMLSRVFIGALFVFAGWGKLTNFAGTSNYINSVLSTGSLTSVVTALVIFIEIVIALVYVYGGYKKDLMGYILIGFTLIATIFFHSDISNANNVTAALKNLAIVGGILATLSGLHKRRVN